MLTSHIFIFRIRTASYVGQRAFKGGPTAGHRPPKSHYQKILTSHFCLYNNTDSTIYANIMHSIYICFVETREKWPSDCKSWLYYPSPSKIIATSPRVLMVTTNGKFLSHYMSIFERINSRHYI